MVSSIQMVQVSGSVGRPSLFGYSVEQSRGFHPTLSGNYWLGQTPTEWYRRAKEALAKYDALIDRMNRIADLNERKAIQAWVSSPATEGTPAQRRQAVQLDLQQDVEAYTPPNVSAYEVERRTNRIERLEELNKKFDVKVTNGEALYGSLPPQTLMTQDQIVAQTQTPSWVLPAVIGGSALGIALLVTLLSGGKGK